MKYNVKSATKIFLKSVKTVNFENTKKFVKSMGYQVILFNTVKGDEIVKKHECEEFTQKYKAFTYCDEARLIMINGILPCETQLYLLLHEVGHILLGHVGEDVPCTKNTILMDAEASSFVERVLAHKKLSRNQIACFVIAFCLGAVIGYTPQRAAQLFTSRTSEMVYITSTGYKFHRADCQYTNDKDCIAIPRTEAVKLYEPCSACQS